LLVTGHAPVSRQLPYQWFDTPNIRVITLKDFRKFVHDIGLKVMKEAAIDTHAEDRYGSIVEWLPNLRATYGIFMIGAGA
jgi:methionine biosynthesis protein MetW